MAKAAPKTRADRRRNGTWIFAYGSLMWDPGFAYLEREPALLRGYHRAFCIFSWHYRGTPELPGLVLGLDRGGACRGIAYRVADSEREAIFAYLDARELLNHIYQRKHLPVTLPRRRVLAHAYVVQRDNPQYTGKLPPERTASLICQGVGQRGACTDYLANTVRHLDELGIADGPLHELLRLVEGRKTA